MSTKPLYNTLKANFKKFYEETNTLVKNDFYIYMLFKPIDGALDTINDIKEIGSSILRDFTPVEDTIFYINSDKNDISGGEFKIKILNEGKDGIEKSIKGTIVDGLALGEMEEGRALGLVLGLKDGDKVLGLNDGTCVGLYDGETLGLVLGLKDGEALGVKEG